MEIHCSAALVRDKFLITGIFLESPDISAQLLQEALKSTKPECQHRLQCQVSGPPVWEIGIREVTMYATS